MITFALPGSATAALLGLLALQALTGGALPADAAERLFGSPSTRTSPSLERRLDRSNRDPAGTGSLERRALQDELRREPPGPERTRRENTLERLPPARQATGPEPLPAPLPTSRLPSSIPPPSEGGLPTSLPPPPLPQPAAR